MFFSLVQVSKTSPSSSNRPNLTLCSEVMGRAGGGRQAFFTYLTIDSQWLCFLIEKHNQVMKNVFYSWDCWRHKKTCRCVIEKAFSGEKKEVIEVHFSKNYLAGCEANGAASLSCKQSPFQYTCRCSICYGVSPAISSDWDLACTHTSP